MVMSAKKDIFALLLSQWQILNFLEFQLKSVENCCRLDEVSDAEIAVDSCLF